MEARRFRRGVQTPWALYRLDQNPLRVAATIKLGRQPESIAVAADACGSSARNASGEDAKDDRGPACLLWIGPRYVRHRHREPRNPTGALLVATAWRISWMNLVAPTES